jgi:hypothetical protein
MARPHAGLIARDQPRERPVSEYASPNDGINSARLRNFVTPSQKDKHSQQPDIS